MRDTTERLTKSETPLGSVTLEARDYSRSVMHEVIDATGSVTQSHRQQVESNIRNQRTRGSAMHKLRDMRRSVIYDLKDTRGFVTCEYRDDRGSITHEFRDEMGVYYA